MNENWYTYERERGFEDKIEDALREQHNNYLQQLSQRADLQYATMDVPKDIALSICKDIRKPMTKIACLGCMLLSKKNIPGRFKGSSSGYHGCAAVARHYALNSSF